MKFEITDQQVLRTAYFTVEGEDGIIYNVNLQENEWFDSWQVMDEDGNEVEDEVLRGELIDLCSNQIESDDEHN
jgi:uncharacterized protein YnzC (UPF0291/DUF896 family)